MHKPRRQRRWIRRRRRSRWRRWSEKTNPKSIICVRCGCAQWRKIYSPLLWWHFFSSLSYKLFFFTFYCRVYCEMVWLYAAVAAAGAATTRCELIRVRVLACIVLCVPRRLFSTIARCPIVLLYAFGVFACACNRRKTPPILFWVYFLFVLFFVWRGPFICNAQCSRVWCFVTSNILYWVVVLFERLSHRNCSNWDFSWSLIIFLIRLTTMDSILFPCFLFLVKRRSKKSHNWTGSAINLTITTKMSEEHKSSSGNMATHTKVAVQTSDEWTRRFMTKVPATIKVTHSSTMLLRLVGRYLSFETIK